MKLSFWKARKLKKIGYYKLPHPVYMGGKKFTWGRKMFNGEIMHYSGEYLARYSIEELTEKFMPYAILWKDLK